MLQKNFTNRNSLFFFCASLSDKFCKKFFWEKAKTILLKQNFFWFFFGGALRSQSAGKKERTMEEIKTVASVLRHLYNNRIVHTDWRAADDNKGGATTLFAVKHVLFDRGVSSTFSSIFLELYPPLAKETWASLLQVWSRPQPLLETDETKELEFATDKGKRVRLWIGKQPDAVDDELTRKLVACWKQRCVRPIDLSEDDDGDKTTSPPPPSPEMKTKRTTRENQRPKTAPPSKRFGTRSAKKEPCAKDAAKVLESSKSSQEQLDASVARVDDVLRQARPDLEWVSGDD